MKYALSILLSSALLVGQTTPKPVTGLATTKGSCSPATTGNNNTFVIRCGIDKEQGAQMIVMLNKILASKADTNLVLSKIAELIESASHPTSTQNCLGSACVQNGSQTNIQQYAVPTPPPNILNLERKEIAARNTPSVMEGELSKNPGVLLTFKVDRMFTNPIFLVYCDRPCSVTTGGTAGVSSPQPISTNNTQISGIALGTMAPLMPGATVSVSVRSADVEKIEVTQVTAYVPPIP